MKKLIECVPNFSEGRDQNVIRQITDAIESVDGVSLLDVDPGASTNRTVVTFVGDPDATVEAAFRAIRKAAEECRCKIAQDQGEQKPASVKPPEGGVTQPITNFAEC